MNNPPLSCEETQRTPSEKQEMVCGQMPNESITEILHNCVQNVDSQSHKNELLPGPISQERAQEKYGCAAESACKSENGEVKPYDQTIAFQDFVKDVSQNGMDYCSRCTDTKVWREDQQNSQPICFQVLDYDNSTPHRMERPWLNLKACHEILKSIAIVLLRFLSPVCMTICINDRRITRAILKVCGVPDSEAERVRLILDRNWASRLLEDATYSSLSHRYRRKYSWRDCEQQLEAILDSSVIERIKKYLDLSGNWSKCFESLQKDSKLQCKQEVIDALKELKYIVEIYNDMAHSANFKIVVDLSLTRELRYYTTSVFEVYVQHGLNSSFILGGGCYDIPVGEGVQWFACGFSVFLPVVMDLKSQSNLPLIPRLMPATVTSCSSQHTFRHCLDNQARDFDDHQRDQPPIQVSKDSKADCEHAEIVLPNDGVRLKLNF